MAKWIKFPADCYVYELAVDGVVRYVGKGIKGRMFISNAELGGKATAYRVIAEGLTSDAALRLERERINSYADGLLWNKPRDELYRQERAHASKVRWSKPGARTRHTQMMRKKWRDSKWRQKTHEAHKEALARPEVKARMQQIRLDTNETRSAKVKALWRNPTYRKRMMRMVKKRAADPNWRRKLKRGQAKTRNDPIRGALWRQRISIARRKAG